MLDDIPQTMVSIKSDTLAPVTGWPAVAGSTLFNLIVLTLRM